jgi:NAD(P)-dependent dehydrogenase (short-subunit alcohol dehydrogenase family)
MKTIVITGASGGMGRTIVKKLCQTYRIIAVDRNQEKIEQLIKIVDSENLITVRTDISQTGWVKSLDSLIQGQELYGIINLAGTSTGDDINNLSDDDWEYSLSVNVTAPMKLIRWATTYFQQQRFGRVINIGSPVGVIGARKASYSASKAALVGLTMSVARSLGKYNACANLILPGATITDMTKDWSAEKQAQIAQGSFLNKLSTPDNITHTIQFLLSPECDYITGSVIDLTAGSMVGH